MMIHSGPLSSSGKVRDDPRVCPLQIQFLLGSDYLTNMLDFLTTELGYVTLSISQKLPFIRVEALSIELG